MNNLFILGNGFDLSHGMDTFYSHFLNYIFQEHINGNQAFNKLIKVPENEEIFDLGSFLEYFGKITNVQSRTGYQINPLEIFIKNNLGCSFIGELISSRYTEGNWSDIEELYFRIINFADKRYLDLTNKDFDNFKEALQKYLRLQEENSRQMNSYMKLFSKLLQAGKTMVVNFNYTNTFEKLYIDTMASYNKDNIVHIHGELFRENNPIVFGYAADDNEVAQLLDKGSNDFLINIKRHQYKKSNQEKRVKEYLDKTEDINIFIIGHSCGVSDKLILNQILNHPNIITINILYYENYNSFYNSHINIYRISNRNNQSYDKIINFIDSHRIPQINDKDGDLDSLNEFINKAIETNKKLAKPKFRGVTKISY